MAEKLSSPERAPATLGSDSEVQPNGAEEQGEVEDDFHPGARLWAVIISLGITLLLTALENTVVSVAMPYIVADLGMGKSYIWITNAFFMCSAAIQPLIGQLSNIFGRRWNMLISVALFTLGSGLCGGSTNGGMLIAARAIQGLGSGGITLLNDIIVSDLVPLRQRGNYIGVILSIYGVGTTLGPFIGGSIVAHTTWRWVFYLNLPIGGLSLVILFVFLQVNYDGHTTLRQKIGRIDYLGNVVLMASAVSILYALAYAGAQYEWSSWHILVPLLLGLLGFLVFPFTQAGPLAAAEPVLPVRLFAHRTSAIIAFNTLMNSALSYWAVFFLPIFFQSGKLYGPQYTGVALLPLSLLAIPGSAIAAISISRWGRYKPVHIFGFAVFMLGLGLLTLNNPRTTVAQWASYESVAALGGGVLLNSQLPAFQSAVPESDQAAASAAWGFIRSIGWVWGVAVPASIFNNRIGQLVGQISDPKAKELLSQGGAYGATTAAQIQQFPHQVQQEMRSVYSQAVQRTFQIAIAFAGVGFLLTLFEDEIVLRKRLDTEYGLKHENDRYNRAEALDAAAKEQVGREISQ
ncbi:DNA repair protein RAD50 [Amniculicola lignicola CBS 123094]|uniref:DNA repair protein RAD50 n=1 Tax=Amniculicola lignicola CBS 123094 TaxID=1392246 RepID=A0A6A5VZ91_9PLEO|nr:DNA repair protein RAD50 [Amniculicola lignicola CBS 123094]